jgi:hypothetical protein
MLVRFFTTVVLIAAAAPAGAQTLVDVQVPAADRSQIRAFENTLRSAIAKAGGQLADRAREVVPGIELQFEADARITSVILPDGEGVQFFVDVPGIRPETAAQWQLGRLLNQRPTQNVAAVTGGAPPPTPVINNPVINPMTNPREEYSKFAHDALVDAILEAGFNLPVKAGQTLTLIVGDGTSGLPRNPLASAPNFLYLRIKGEDLLALRQNAISRDQAKGRIRQMVY